MNYLQLLSKVNKDFNVDLFIVKEKACYLMLEDRKGLPGTLGGPDCGYRSNTVRQYVEIQGWCYVLIDEVWKRLPDGVVGWRNNSEESDYGKSLEDANAEESSIW